jgi:diguanylate cyclase (GGDEF)-like protein
LVPVDFWNKGTLRSLLIPGGLLLLAAAVVLQGGFRLPSASVLDFYYYSAFAAAMLLGWRFHSSRAVFALTVLLLAHRAVEYFSAGHILSSGPGRIAFEAVAFLIPLNFVALALIGERGFAIPAIASRLGLLFVESVFVAVVCRPGEIASPAFLHLELLDRHWFPWTKIPQPALLAFAWAFAVLAARFLLYRKPVQGGLLWSLVAAFLGLQAGGVGKVAGAYLATAGLILASSIIEDSYLLAYHDELTALPARRAFNDALLRLDAPYVIAVLDIDHFKSFNDTYGHDTGDQVLRMVAARLARVSGGGHSFRVGGEEFCILFPGRSLSEVVPHLESLRVSIEGATFLVRSGGERRRRPAHGRDRRKTPRRKPARMARTPSAAGTELGVTVSIGAAEPGARAREVEQVLRAADKALYRAKHGGRNRVEMASSARARAARAAGRNIA